MTTGSKTRNLTTAVYTDAGPGVAGYYYTKTWNGADYPSEPVRTENRWVKPHTIRSFHQLPKTGDIGRMSGGLMTRYDLLKSEGYFKTVYTRPPRRALSENHAYSCTWNTYHDPLMRWFHPSLGWKTGTVHSVVGPASHRPDPWSSFDDLALISKLREQVAGSTFNAGVFLGEGHEALRMIGDNAIKIATSLKHLKRGQWTNAARALGVQPRVVVRPHRSFKPDPLFRFPEKGSSSKRRKVELDFQREMSSRWLELQYGWLPLLKDCEDGARFLAHHLNTPLRHVVVVRRDAGGKQADLQRDQFLPTWYYPPTHSELKSRSQLKAILTEVNVPQLAGLTNLASLSWELLPWSFVADWFIPIGSWLDARGLAQAMTGTFVTTHVYKTRVANYRGSVPLYGGIRLDSASFFSEQGSMSRTISSTLQVPHPSIKPLNKALSWLHCENAVALLTQVVHSGRP